MKSTTTATGIYVSTKTEFNSLREMHAHQVSLGRVPIGGELDSQEAWLIPLLRGFGDTVTWPADPWPADAAMCPEKFVGLRLMWWGAIAKTPNAVFSDPTLNGIIHERAVTAMNELSFLRGAMERRDIPAIGRHSLRLGQFLEMLRITPHEPDVIKGRASRMRAKKRGEKGNITRQKLADERRLCIIELYRKSVTGNKGMRMAAIQTALENTPLECSIGTIKNALKRTKRA